MTHRDRDGAMWFVWEFFDDRLVAGVLVFERPDGCRVAWGSPINWRATSNMAALFDLSVQV